MSLKFESKHYSQNLRVMSLCSTRTSGMLLKSVAIFDIIRNSRIFIYLMYLQPIVIIIYFDEEIIPSWDSKNALKLAF
jgi:hypothetical protein